MTAREKAAEGTVRTPLLKIVDILKLLSCSRRWLERHRAAGLFPEPDKEVGQSPRWRHEVIEKWLESPKKKLARRPKKAQDR